MQVRFLGTPEECRQRLKRLRLILDAEVVAVDASGTLVEVRL